MNISDILVRHKEEIIRQWVTRLHTDVSQGYATQPLDSLYKTISLATEANFDVIVRNDFSKIDWVIAWIGKIRAREGFSLSEVQKAFELYRTVLLEFLGRDMTVSELREAMERVNSCLSYTIHKFSDYFQALHEAEIRNYAQILELKVEKRTKQLAESELKYRTLVEKIRDGYFVNQQGRMVFVNKAFCVLHGYTKREIIGKQYTDFIAQESMVEVKKIYEKRVAEGLSKEQYIYYRLHKNGTALPTENTVTLTYYQGKMAAIGICRDITERVEVERRIRESESLAHIGHLTTSLAHEIRNPLSSAKMSIQMILKNETFEEKDQRRLEILSQQITRLDRIVTEMLDFAKPVKFNFKPASITEVVDGCLEVIDGKIRDKNITVTRSYARGLPVLKIDEEKMEQAITNLLLNSVEAVSDDGKINIVAKRGRDKKMIEVVISDNGPGVCNDDLPYIFDPFFSKKAKGTGLGLANAKRVIEAHNASIQASTGNLGGMSFSITLPIPTPSSKVNKARK